MGGTDGRLSIEESVPSLVDVLLAKRGRPSLEYLDYLGRTRPVVIRRDLCVNPRRTMLRTS